MLHGTFHPGNVTGELGPQFKDFEEELNENVQ